MHGKTVRHFLISLTLGAAMATPLPPAAPASEFSEPWKKSDRALVIDAYEYNSIDWEKLATDKRIAGFISKAPAFAIRPRRISSLTRCARNE